MGRKCTIKLYYQQLPLQCFKNCIEVSDCHTHTGLFKPELPLHTGIRIKIAMKLKTHSQKEIAPGEARTHGLQIMRLTRCLLRYGGNNDISAAFYYRDEAQVLNYSMFH